MWKCIEDKEGDEPSKQKEYELEGEGFVGVCGEYLYSAWEQWTKKKKLPVSYLPIHQEHGSRVLSRIF